MSFLFRIALAPAFFCLASSVLASSITYSFSGTASGTLGGTTFTNALIQETAFGDTANIMTLMEGAISAFAEPVSITITIAGLGTTTVTQPSAMYSIPTPVVIASGFPDLPYAVLGTVDSPPSLSSFTGLGVLGSDALLGYNLATSIGPLTGSPGGVGYAPLDVVETSNGYLSFTTNIVPTGQGTFSATTPEPGNFLIVSSALALLGCRIRRASKVA